MEFMPALGFGILNGGLLLLAYFVALSTSILAFPPEKRKKLVLKPQYPRGHPRRIIRMLGTIAALSFVALSFFTALRLGTALFYVGLAVYAIGYAVVMASLLDFKRAPLDDAVTAGLYRYSRNPQWLGLVLVYAGAALAMGAGLHLLLVLTMAAVYHLQILLEEQICLSAYGEKYREYMRRVPRYLFV